MSLAAICWWTMVRSVVLCLLAWPVCRVIERTLRSQGDRRQSVWLFLLLVPACYPELLVGYGFRDFALAQPKWAELLCSVLLFVRIVPIGTATLIAAPRPSVDAAAIHCRRMLLSRGSRAWRDWSELAWCYWHGPISRALPALALMNIVAFQEFELAALLQTISWTDWFIVAQRLGTTQSEMLRQSLWPLLWQLPVLAGILRWVRSSSTDDANNSRGDDVDRVVQPAIRGLGLVFILVLILIGALIPTGLVGWRMLEGLQLLYRQRVQQVGLAREILTSGSIAVCSGICAWSLSHPLKLIAVPGSIPGLFGSLLLSLGTVVLFQQSWFRPAYDTPLPWALALTVWLLPRAVMLRIWLHTFRSNESLHAAQLLPPSSDRRRLLWRLRDQPRFLAVSLLCYWAYCDLPTAYLLAPSGMVSGLVRLYNFMHFGRSAALSAEATVFFGTPVLIFLGTFLFLHWYRGRAERKIK